MPEPEVSQKRALDRLAAELGENPAITGAFVARMASKIGVPVQMVVEKLTDLVVELKGGAK
jgi:hypothetical protein